RGARGAVRGRGPALAARGRGAAGRRRRDALFGRGPAGRGPAGSRVWPLPRSRGGARASGQRFLADTHAGRAHGGPRAHRSGERGAGAPAAPHPLPQLARPEGPGGAAHVRARVQAPASPGGAAGEEGGSAGSRRPPLGSGSLAARGVPEAAQRPVSHAARVHDPPLPARRLRAGALSPGAPRRRRGVRAPRRSSPALRGRAPPQVHPRRGGGARSRLRGGPPPAQPRHPPARALLGRQRREAQHGRRHARPRRAHGQGSQPGRDGSGGAGVGAHRRVRDLVQGGPRQPAAGG
ncbi:hypothetical protein H632_c4318p0, partial [Helicosporidium sp. ATCC 50920]